MDHAVDPVERGRDQVEIADVAADQLDIVEDLVASTAAVHLLDQAVEDADFVTPLQKHLRHMAADETSPARDENSCRHTENIP